ncbi:hypothetical protein c7_R291 [Megavirus courdo7]|uniref:Chorein N-terminal domain-containing protein n=1 Tax=Megavirus courdo7 TaxID=1128135 RepID=H2EAD4_9VIRU|nr:hypothetical protein c7_R291 [Megavirus courdo7]
MEWLKNICSVPIKLGLDKTNFVVMNLITYIFNIYGKKILKTDNDEIISHNECINDINIFYLHPLQFREIKYNWNENIFKINTGTITNLTVAFPWTSLFTQSTKVNIDNISIEISMDDSNHNMIKSMIDDPDSYLNIHITENSDINDVYTGINDIVKKYFSNIKVNIGTIDIVIINHFIIKIKNCEYTDNKLTIEKVKIISKNNKSTRIQNINLSITNDNEFDINISKIDISSDFIDNLPIIKFKSDKNTPESNININIKVSDFLFSKLFAQNIDLNYCCSGIISFGNYINDLIEQFKSKKEPKTNNSKITKSVISKFLNIKKAQISLDYLSSKYIFIIDNTKICLSDKSIIDTSAHIFIDNYLISKINAKYISPNNIHVIGIEFYLDPNIFDILVQSLGLLIPNNDENNLTQYLPDDIMDKIQDALDNSIVSSNMYDLERNTNKLTESIINTYIDTKNKNCDKPIITILSESVYDLKSIFIGDYKHQKSNDNLKISLDSINIYLYDKLSICESKNQNSPFVCFVVKNISIIYQKLLETTMTYKIDIEKIALIDINCLDPKWKYFLKFTGSNAINIYLSKQYDTVKLNINLNPIILNIKEETLVRLLAYISEIKITPTNDNIIFIEKFSMNEINLTINYYPIILKKIDAGTNNLFIKNFKIIIPPYMLKNVDGLDKLGKSIQDNFYKIINPNNIAQFVPNIKLVKPYVMPINNIIVMIGKYIHSPINRNNLRKITCSINKNTGILSNLILEKLKKYFTMIDFLIKYINI